MKNKRNYNKFLLHASNVMNKQLSNPMPNSILINLLPSSNSLNDHTVRVILNIKVNINLVPDHKTIFFIVISSIIMYVNNTTKNKSICIIYEYIQLYES